MNKVSIMTDSNSGITQKEAEALGIKLLPMPFLIDDETYFENVNLTQEEFYQKLEEDVDISTSQPSPESVMTAWNELLEISESVVYIPMSSGLSGSCQTAKMLAEEYEGRVQVVDNQRVSVTQKQSVFDALSMAENGKTASEIKEYLERTKFDSSIYIMVDTLKYLKKGGRITPAAAALGSALRLKPVLQIQGEKLDAFSIARTKKQGISKMLSAMETDIIERFGGLENIKKIHLEVAHSNNKEAALAFAEEIKEKFGVTEVEIDPLALSIACHIGSGSLAIACTVALKEEDN